MANGAITDVSLAGGMEIVFETDFATNYNVTRNAWVNNYTDIIGTIGNASFAAGALTSTEITSSAGAAVTSLAAGIIDDTSVGTLTNSNFAFVDSNERVDVGQWLGTAATSGTGGPDVNVNAVNDSTTAATNLARSARGIVLGAAVGTPSTTIIDTDLTEATTDHYKGRILTFIDGNVAGQSSDITGYNGTTKELTVTAYTNAPAATDIFVIT